VKTLLGQNFYSTPTKVHRILLLGAELLIIIIAMMDR
jgi:hypothetical protein